MDPIQVVIVDDEHHNRKLLERSLVEEFSVVSFSSGEECLAGLEHLKPDVFLLDVRMPGGMDGFELCKKLRANKEYEALPILFLSAMDSLEQKIEGYECGADDYITKPIELDALQRKLANIRNRIMRKREYHAESESIKNVAMTALTNSGEIGELLRFYEGLADVTSYRQLAEYTVNALLAFGLNTVVQLRLSNDTITASTSGSYNDLEEKLMLQGQSLDRIYTFGHRCLFTFKQSSLLVRKMPDDIDKAGRIRDHFASILNGVEARMESLKSEYSLRQQNEGLVLKALGLTHSALEDILTKFKQHEVNISQIIDYMRRDMDVAFAYLDLTEDQEAHLLRIFDTSKNQIDELFKDGQKIDAQFESVIETLQALLKKR